MRLRAAEVRAFYLHDVALGLKGRIIVRRLYLPFRFGKKILCDVYFMAMLSPSLPTTFGEMETAPVKRWVSVPLQQGVQKKFVRYASYRHSGLFLQLGDNGHRLGADNAVRRPDVVAALR